MPPGAGLGAALARVELAVVPNDRILEVLAAQYRQLSHEQARMAATLAEVGRCAGFPAPGEVRRLAGPGRFAADETRAALCWTRRAAEAEHELAEAVMSRWPAVFEAWSAGEIDRPRVRVFQHYLDGLADHQAGDICAVALPRARRLTTGQLVVLLRRMVIAVDPDAAERWYRRGVTERDVIAYPAADGTVCLSATGLPADEAEAACARVQHLAARAKRAGHPGLIGQIRCDLLLGLLDGRFHQMTADQVIATLIAEFCPDGIGDPPRPAQPRAAARARSGESARPGEPDESSRPGESGEPAQPSEPGEPGQSGGFGDDQRVGIEVRVGLATLLGRDELPAEIPGLGLLPAPAARRRVHRQRRAEWRFALTDANGRLVFDGLTRRRPRGIRRDGPPGGIVELHVPLALLAELTTAPGNTHPDWADLIADIAAQYTRADEHRDDLDARPGARLPGAALRRHTEIRDRTCTFTGCRRRAHAADHDHTRAYRLGGTTTRINGGPLCAHDHTVKHDGGWRLEQPEPGTFIWHSPLGGVYRTTGESFLPPMPDPAPIDPPPGPDDIRPVEHDPGPILRGPSPPPPPGEAQPRGDPDEPPPF